MGGGGSQCPPVWGFAGIACVKLSGEKVTSAQKWTPARLAPQHQAQWKSCTRSCPFLIGGIISSYIHVAGLRIGSFLVE